MVKEKYDKWKNLNVSVDDDILSIMEPDGGYGCGNDYFPFDEDDYKAFIEIVNNSYKKFKEREIRMNDNKENNNATV